MTTYANHPNRGRKPPLKIYKVDAQYILLREDDPIALLGERAYHRTPGAALQVLARQIEDHINDGASYRAVRIEPNEHADRALIEKYGFTAVKVAS